MCQQGLPYPLRERFVNPLPGQVLLEHWVLPAPLLRVQSLPGLLALLLLVWQFQTLALLGHCCQ